MTAFAKTVSYLLLQLLFAIMEGFILVPLLVKIGFLSVGQFDLWLHLSVQTYVQMSLVGIKTNEDLVIKGFFNWNYLRLNYLK